MEYHDVDAATLTSFSDYDDHYKVRFFNDPETGLRACIAVHNINLGPALGGCRMYSYGSEDDAIRDVLRLSRGMTYKNALAGLPLGGGKSVILGNPATEKTDALMAAMGRAVDTLGGDYISAEDSGTNEHDMATMRQSTPYVMGQAAAEGALGGDPSPVTAYGVFCGIKAALKHKYGSDSMDGLTVAVQGLGSVGYDLCRQLDAAGAILFVTDVNDAVLEKAGREFSNVQVVGLDEIFSVDAKVFAPCALGAQVNAKTIPQMTFEIIAGAANNQLETPEDDDRLMDKGILYAPDYAINAGGVIAVGYEYFEQSGHNPFPHDLTRANMMRHVEQIEQTLEKIFSIAEREGISPGHAADALAEAIFKGEAAAARSSDAA
ncbi:MAG: Glu/Leu/Phe/Val dehydrogenase [Rhodospirillales bacterium]|nr:Glu/Leu/Phe/Val dehydrogenase [Rhodospirillales bacterium]MCB9995003.1 Glu/Leu/Phe/Val dehydrogenase [Rhodospirillales bacterium]